MEEETMAGPEILRPGREPLGRVRTLACTLAIAALGACATAGRPEAAPSPIASRVVVRNNSWDHVTLYLGHRGALWRIGDVDGLSDVSFPVPGWLRPDLDDVYFVARPIGGRSFRSEPFAFSRGTTAVWTIGNQAAASYVALR
jgi:hypothetical protein